MINWSGMNGFQIALMAVVIALACMGLISFTYLVFGMVRNHDSKYDDLDDYYDGCDMNKVRKYRGNE